MQMSRRPAAANGSKAGALRIDRELISTPRSSESIARDAPPVLRPCQPYSSAPPCRCTARMSRMTSGLC